MSLTSCIKKAGPALRAEDKTAILAAARTYRTQGMSANEAALKAVQEQLDAIGKLLDSEQPAGQPVAESQAPEKSPSGPRGSGDVGAAPDQAASGPNPKQSKKNRAAIGAKLKPPKKPRGGGNWRRAAWAKNPFMTFLATHGLKHDRFERGSLKVEFSPDKPILVSGYGPIFRKTGLNIDMLAERAREEGYLPQGAPDNDVYDLIRRAIGGERIVPIFGQAGVDMLEAEMRDREVRLQELYDQQPSPDDWIASTEYAQADLEETGYDEASADLKKEVQALLALAEEAGIDIEFIQERVANETQDATEADYYRAARDALQAAIHSRDGDSRQDHGQQGEAGAESEIKTFTSSLTRTASWIIREKATGRVVVELFDKAKVDAINTEKYEAVPIQDHLASLNSPNALTSPTRQDIEAQQDRTDNAQALDDKAQIDREADGFQLQTQSQESRQDNTGDMFGGPSVDDFQKAQERKPGKASSGPDLFNGATEQRLTPETAGKLKSGDVVQDDKGTKYLAHAARHKWLDAFPIVNGKADVNAESKVTFHLDPETAQAYPERNHSPVYLTGENLNDGQQSNTIKSNAKPLAPTNFGSRVTPQVASRQQLESFIGIAADSIQQLREVDVERVLAEAPVHFRASLATHIKNSRPEFADEIREVMDSLRDPTPVAAQSPEAMRAETDLKNALADLGDILGKNTRLNMMPEQEQKLLPVLVRLFDAAFRLGYHKFKDAAKFALDQIRAALGNEAADSLTLDHLQGAYIALGARDGADSKRAVIDVESKVDIENHTAKAQNGAQDVPSLDSRVEPNRPEPAPGAAVGTSVPSGSRAADQGAGADGKRSDRTGSGRQGDAGISLDGAAPGGERGDQLLRGDDRQPGLAGSDARTDFGERSGDSGITGVPPEPIPASKVGAVAGSGIAEIRDRQQQRNASVDAKPGLQSVRDTLPYLLEGQQEDVHIAETRFAKPEGYGMLFTNGTGTGKTFVGLGLVKRFDLQGKPDTLIVVPDDKIAADWIDSGKALGLNITKLADTQDAGKGIVITSYANMGANDELAKRNWSLIVADEAHTLMQSSDATPTGYLQNLRAITHHPDGVLQRFTMQNRQDIDRAMEIDREIIGNNKIINKDDTMDVMRQSLQSANEKLEKELKPIKERLAAKRFALDTEMMEMQGAKRARVAFLSATPFAYEKTVDWANGYLFDYKDGYPYDSKVMRQYNQPDERQYFMMTRFGYSMRYNKLTEPDGSKIDRGMLQRQFNGELKKNGVLAGRMLDVKPDYDRRFVLVDSAIGNKIDEAIEWLRESAHAQREAQKDVPRENQETGMAALRDAINDQFDYLSRRYLLEAIKAEEVIPIVKKHIEMGRKVVVFHDYKKGGAINPFDIRPSPLTTDADEQTASKTKSFNAAVVQFRKQFPELLNLGDLQAPIEVFKKNFPGVMLVNGDEKKADLLKRYKAFQDDGTGPQVMLVQSAKNKGWSGHDTTGKHQRVLINLGQPTAPTLAIQQEGRIYRTGQVSNAIMRYLNTGTNWEKWAFATTIASRASTAENLGMGELSRALKDSFIAAFDESDAYPPGHEGEGTGGKERDKASNNALTEYDRAKTHYWATQKKNSKTKAQEGVDYFATPEPIGLKMTQWLDARGEEDTLEPSAGHGAIARWLPETTKRTVIEPSTALRSRLAMVMNPAEDRIIDGTFEDLAVVNKFDGIVMNPPFGSGGKTAIDHLAKAATHLRDGGRIVALIPTGPAADKKFDKWFYEESEKPAKPLYVDPNHGPIYKGDTLTITGFGQLQKLIVDKVDGSGTGPRYVRDANTPPNGAINTRAINKVEPTGKRTETYKPAEGLNLVANIKLPQVTFERAGTAVATRIVVIGKGGGNAAQRDRDYSDITDISELFDKLENLDFAKRSKPEQAEKPASPLARRDGKLPDAKPEKKAALPGQKVTLGGEEYTVATYTTQAGKTKRGVWMDSKDKASKFSPRAFTTAANRGKWFVDEYWFNKGPSDDAPALSRGVAREPESGYDATYATDLFGNPVPAFAGRAANSKPGASRVRGDVQPASALRDTPAPPGEYFVNTIVGSEVRRKLGASRITTPEEAAQATAYLYRSAVERFDGIVTDKDGKPLAVVGGFKGAINQASVYLPTLMAEAIRVPGAANIWFSHNHPSGNPELSRADIGLNSGLTDLFHGSGIEPKGLLAISGGKFSYVDAFGEKSTDAVPAASGGVSVPVIEREQIPGKDEAPRASNPLEATSQAVAFYKKSGGPGIMLLNASNAVVAWVPITDNMTGLLRGTGGAAAIYRAVSQGNSPSSIIVHGGELDAPARGHGYPTVSQNIAYALSVAGARPLDVINAKSLQSAAERGLDLVGSQMFSRAPFQSALEKEVGNIKANAQPAEGWIANIRGLVSNGKVKGDEVEWSGITDWLGLQQGKVTRDAVMQYLEGNGVKVEEVVLGRDEKAISNASDKLYYWAKSEEERGHSTRFTDAVLTGESLDSLRRIADGNPYVPPEVVEYLDGFESIDTPTKYSQYQLPGGPLSRDTEILSRDGWIRMDEVQIGDLVMTRCDADGTLEWQEVEAVPTVYADKLYHFKNQSINMRVTACHNMLVKRRRRSSGGLMRVKADALWKMSEAIAPLTGTWAGADDGTLYGADAGDVAELMGWYIAEGSAVSENGKKSTLAISQSRTANPEKCARIEALMDRLGVKWNYVASGPAYYLSIKSMDRGLVGVLHAQGNSRAKFVPGFMFDQPPAVLSRLMEGLLLGDGCLSNKASTKRKPRWVFHSNSKQLADDMQLLALLTGKRGRIGRRPKTGLYEVSINDKAWASIDDAKHAIVDYNDIAYCVTVKNHAIYVRTDGVAAFTGNSNYREVLLTLPVKQATPTKDEARRNELEGKNNRGQITKVEFAELLQLRKSPRADDRVNYKSPHWDQPNVLAHIRLNDRVDADGKRVLFVEEVQSDFGQDTKKQRDAINRAVDDDFTGIIERMKKAGVLQVECD